MEQVHETLIQQLGIWLTNMFEVGKETGGETFVRRMEEEFYGRALQHGAKLRSHLKVNGTDCTAIASLMDTINRGVGCRWDGHVENSPTVYDKHITACPLAGHFSRSPDICLRLGTSAYRGAAASINPNATFEMDKCISMGDETCHYRFEIK